MTFDNFFQLINNTLWDTVDPDNRDQCFDLTIGWCKAIGLPDSIFSGLTYAYQIFDPSTAIARDNFDFILNTPDAVPQKGDIIVWDKSFNGTAGHTGVATGVGDTNSFECFEQNDPTDSNCHLKTYNYNSVIGWLHPRNITAECPEKAEWDKLIQHNSLYSNADAVLKVMGDKDTTISARDTQILNLQNEITAVQAHDKTDCDLQLSNQRNDLLKANADQVNALQKEIDDLKKGTNPTPVETPLSERFRGKPLKDKLIALIDILTA